MDACKWANWSHPLSCWSFGAKTIFLYKSNAKKQNLSYPYCISIISICEDYCNLILLIILKKHLRSIYLWAGGRRWDRCQFLFSALCCWSILLDSFPHYPAGSFTRRGGKSPCMLSCLSLNQLKDSASRIRAYCNYGSLAALNPLAFQLSRRRLCH